MVQIAWYLKTSVLDYLQYPTGGKSTLVNIVTPWSEIETGNGLVQVWVNFGWSYLNLNPLLLSPIILQNGHPDPTQNFPNLLQMIWQWIQSGKYEKISKRCFNQTRLLDTHVYCISHLLIVEHMHCQFFIKWKLFKTQPAKERILWIISLKKKYS